MKDLPKSDGDGKFNAQETRDGMKKFFVVLAAGLVLFFLYLGSQRLERWQQSELRLVNHIDGLRHGGSKLSGHYKSIDSLKRQLDLLQEGKSELGEAYRNLALTLDQKPFHLPLSADEKRLRKLCEKSAPSQPTPVAASSQK